MKKSTKVLLIVSLCMIFAGIFVCGSILFMTDFEWGRVSGVAYKERVTTVDEVFADVDVHVQSANVQLFVSSSDECRVEVTDADSDKMNHQITVENNTLMIRFVDDRQWYECIRFNFGFASESVRIYLPAKTYENIMLESTSGSVTVNEGLVCENLKAESTSGAVRVYSAAVQNDITAKTTSGQVSVAEVFTGKLEASSTSGRVNVSNIQQVNNVTIKATSGKIEAVDINCVNFSAEGVSGGVICSGVIAEETLIAETTSGSVQVLKCDANTLSLKSTSGSIRGTLLSDKMFITDTVSGSINVPASSQGGVCSAKTTSGSIDLKVE